MAGDAAAGEPGGRLSGLVPLVVVGVAVVLFFRSCLPGLASIPFFGTSGGDADDLADADDTGNSDTEGTGNADDAADGGQASGSTAPAVTTTIDPALERTQLMQPREPECPAADGSSDRHLQWTRPPPMCIDPAKTYTATLHTDRGDIVLELDSQNAPVTVNHFVFLARWHYYDGVDFHQVRTYQYIETGDPIGHLPGLRGDPGYWVPDELPTEEPYYPIYSAGLANQWEPDTGGSIFFIVTGMAGQLPHIYTRFGQVVQGRSVVNAIDDTGISSEDSTGEYAPTEPTVIRSITITER